MGDLTGDQRVDRAMENDNPSGADALIRKMVENVSHEDIDFPADLRNILKPKSFNKRKGKKGEKKSAPEYKEPVRIQPPEESRTDSIDPEVENQQVYEEPIRVQPEILDNGLSKSAETHNDTSRGDNSEEIEGNLRRSTRVPKISARALHMLSHQPELQEASIFRESEN